MAKRGAVGIRLKIQKSSNTGKSKRCDESQSSFINGECIIITTINKNAFKFSTYDKKSSSIIIVSCILVYYFQSDLCYHIWQQTMTLKSRCLTFYSPYCEFVNNFQMLLRFVI